MPWLPAGSAAPTPWRRVELRYVDLKAGRHLQVTAYDDVQAHTSNHVVGDAARAVLDDLLDQPFANWHVETTPRPTSCESPRSAKPWSIPGPRADGAEVDRDHDRDKGRLLAEDDPVFRALGLSDHEGRMKPSRQGKYRQVEEFLRILDASVGEALEKGHLRTSTPSGPCRSWTSAAATPTSPSSPSGSSPSPRPGRPSDRYRPARPVAHHNEKIASDLGVDADLPAPPRSATRRSTPPDVVLALHACDTATDDALARAIEWEAPLVLAAPCCHHDIAAQLRRQPTPAPYAMLTRDGILRERLADTLTDGLRASLLRLEGYRVDVMQFVGSQHTPRNTLLRAVRTGRR